MPRRSLLVYSPPAQARSVTAPLARERHSLRVLALLLLLAPGLPRPTSAGEDTAAAEDRWTVKWKDNLRFTSPDGDIELKLGGRAQLDFVEASGDQPLEALGAVRDGNEFRRARLFVEGSFENRFSFKVEYDFAGSDAEPKDVWLQMRGLPAVGAVKVGHFKEPFGLEELNSARFISFLERSPISEALAPSRNMGVMVGDSKVERGGVPRLTWALGIFQENDSAGEVTSSDWNLTGRLTGLPIWQQDGRRMLHLGVAASDRSQENDTFRYRSRPGVHLADRVLDTGQLPAEGALLLGLELHAVSGPLWVQSEWQQSDLDSPDVVLGPRDPSLEGFTVDVGWYLTGEHRAWKPASAAIDRTRPLRPVSDGGIGAWELVARWAEADFRDVGDSSARIEATAVGVNWTPHSAFRVQLNWVRTDRDELGEVDALGLRFAVDW
ncbi:MAG: hypothetical protein DWQ36_25225 [Acidobacteria bacterium]|nr:MAG: hypothetical protein DWQ30_02165 [Acidobacteriota bacterium]REJ99521.1 MAG: hypothetical protein DWQ36_25225 [Acidobacteriota bacterium]